MICHKNTSFKSNGKTVIFLYFIGFFFQNLVLYNSNEVNILSNKAVYAFKNKNYY